MFCSFFLARKIAKKKPFVLSDNNRYSRLKRKTYKIIEQMTVRTVKIDIFK